MSDPTSADLTAAHRAFTVAYKHEPTTDGDAGWIAGYAQRMVDERAVVEGKYCVYCKGSHAIGGVCGDGVQRQPRGMV